MAVSPAAAAAPTAAARPAAMIDIGANLLDGMFRGRYGGGSKRMHPPDLDAVLARAAAAGVSHIIVTAGNLRESRAALALARSVNAARAAAGLPLRLHSTVGVHPTRTRELDFDEAAAAEVAPAAAASCGCGEGEAAAPAAAAGDSSGDEAATAGSVPTDKPAYVAALCAVLEDGVRDGTVVAVGECGLDYDREHFAPREVQRRHWELHFDLARRFSLPLFLHDRNTAGDFAGAWDARHRRGSYEKSGGRMRTPHLSSQPSPLCRPARRGYAPAAGRGRLARRCRTQLHRQCRGAAQLPSPGPAHW